MHWAFIFGRFLKVSITKLVPYYLIVTCTCMLIDHFGRGISCEREIKKGIVRQTNLASFTECTLFQSIYSKGKTRNIESVIVLNIFY